MRHTYTELHRGADRIERLDAMLRRGAVYELQMTTFNDRGHRTTITDNYTLAGIYPHHAVFRRRIKGGRELTYSFTKAELAGMIFKEESLV